MTPEDLYIGPGYAMGAQELTKKGTKILFCETQKEEILLLNL